MKKFGVIVIAVLAIMAIIATAGFADFVAIMAKNHMVLTDKYNFPDGDEVTICWSKKVDTYDSTLYPGNIKSWGSGQWFMSPYDWNKMLEEKNKNYKQFKTEIVTWEW